MSESSTQAGSGATAPWLRRGTGSTLRPTGRRLLGSVAVLASGLVLALTLLPPLAGVLASLWWLAVVVIVRSDLDRFIIPDRATVAVALLGVVHLWADVAANALGAVEGASSAAAAVGLAGAAFALFGGLAWLFHRRTGHEGLGFGDVKLAAASALWLTPSQGVAALEIACLAAIGLVLVRRWSGGEAGAAIPFGAFLAPAAWLVSTVGPAAWPVLGFSGA